MSTGLRIGRYELGERLGTGGFGVVYHARDTELGRELAIKVLRPEYQTQPDVVARFLKEARAAAKIDHPGIVTVFECGTISGTKTAQDGNAYIAMELLRGFSLAQQLEKKGRLSPGDAVLIARQVAAALAVAHAAGIVHRDLKPDNVYLLPDKLVKGGFRIKILDFGVAKLAEPKEVGVNTHSQMMLGTPKYMSPEQARSARAVDQRTDVYTLGCMLYEMVTGQAPYEGPGAIDMIIQHTTAPIPSPAEIVHGLPTSIDMLIRRMLEKEPDDRPPSMKDIDKALEEIQQELVPPSIPPTPMRPKPPTAPPAIPPIPTRQPPRPTPAPPTGLTPTPAVATTNVPAPRPTPGASAFPSPSTGASPQDSPTIDTAKLPGPTRPTPLPPVPRFPLSEDEITTNPSRDAAPSRVPLFIGVGVLVAGLAAGVAFIALRNDPTTSASATFDAAPATKLSVDEVHRLAQECADFAKLELWKDLKDCAERLEAHNAEAGARFFKQADDEAANQQKFEGIGKDIAKGNLSGARDLVKRIGPSSVYTERAQKALAEAEADQKL